MEKNLTKMVDRDEKFHIVILVSERCSIDLKGTKKLKVRVS